MLRKLNDDHAALLKKEEMSKDFPVFLRLWNTAI